MKKFKVIVTDNRTKVEESDLCANPYTTVEIKDNDSDSSCVKGVEDDCCKVGCKCGHKSHKHYADYHNNMKELSEICDETQKVKPDFVSAVIEESKKMEDTEYEDEDNYYHVEDDDMWDGEMIEDDDIEYSCEDNSFSKHFEVSSYDDKYEDFWLDVQKIDFSDEEVHILIVPTSSRTLMACKENKNIGDVTFTVSKKENSDSPEDITFSLKNVTVRSVTCSLEKYNRFDSFEVDVICDYNV